MSRAATRSKILELFWLAVISCGAGGLIAALVAIAVATLNPEAWPAAFLQAFPIFAVLVFAAALLIELIVPEPEIGARKCSE